MPWGGILDAVGTVVAILLGLYGAISARRATQRETGTGDIDAFIEEYSRGRWRPPAGWETATERLVISNDGPGDANEVEVETHFPDFDQSPDTGPFLVGLPDQTFTVAAGRKLRLGCYAIEKLGGEWQGDGVPFPVDLVISWRDGSGQRRRTFTLNEATAEP